MKEVYKFEIGEITISKQYADLIRERILQIAKEKDIGTEPIQFERLLSDIISKMVELSQNYDFIFNGETIDFSKDNFTMFKSKVLKSFLSIKKNEETITLQKKNLDILCFYSNNISWNELKKRNNYNNKDDDKNKDIENNNSKSISYNKKIYIVIISILIIAILFLSITVSILNNKNNETQKFIAEREMKYQSALRSLIEQNNQLNNFDYKNYDSLIIPNNLPKLMIIDFNSMNGTYNNYPYKYYIIVSDSGASIKSEPGIKLCDKLGKSYAFGFGLRNCISGCFKFAETVPNYKQPNSTVLRIKFNNTHYVSYISFKWVEIGHNWGSVGYVCINGECIGDPMYNSIGNWPSSTMIKDERLIEYRAIINKKIDQFDIFVFDISNESEIFVNDIIIYGRNN